MSEHFRQNWHMGPAGGRTRLAYVIARGRTRLAYVNGIEPVTTESALCIAGDHFHVRFVPFLWSPPMQTCSRVVTSYAKPADPGDGRAAVEISVIAVVRGKFEDLNGQPRTV
jgi:hypothetical protein